MKHKLATALLLSVLTASSATAAFAAAENYTLDPNHTNIYWSANHFGFSNPSGKFATVEGTLVLDEAKPDASKVDVKISTGSVITGIEKFDAHLKSDAFFDIVKFPTATFVSDKVEITGKETAKVHGNLTLHGVSKPVVLDVHLNKIGENPINKKKTAGFSASTVIKRSEFGINFALPGVSDDVKITIETEANLS